MAVVEGAGPGEQDGDDASPDPSCAAEALPCGTPVGERSCPVHWFAGRVHEVLDEVTAGGVRVSGLSPAATAEAVVELTRAEARIAALKAALLPHADTLGVAYTATPVATSTGSWLASQTRTPTGAAHRLVKVAARLEADCRPTLAAAVAGEVDPAQVEVIVTALDRLPSWVSGEERVLAEQHLLGLAVEHDAKTLKQLARHLAHVIDPEAADADLAKKLEKEEADAARRTTFSLVDDGKGLCHGKFKISSLHGAMLSAALNALASPTRPDAIVREVPDPARSDDPDAPLVQRAAPELLGEAFTELIERYPTKKLPKTGGGLATVLVTIPLAVLEGRLGVATLSTGGQLTAGAARRLACSHGLIAAVLGAKSQPLDLSRRVRLHTEPQRIAMAVRDKTCTAEGCQIPAAWCHAHHVIPWSRGGGTSVKDGRMVCGRHHTLIHRPDYHADYLPDGKIRLTRRHRQ